MTLLRAALGLHPRHVQIDGQTWTVADLPAAAWIAAITDRAFPLSILPGLLKPEQQPDFLDAVQDGTYTTDQVERAGWEVLTAVGGRRWWETVKLVRAVDGDATGGVIGRLALARVDARTDPLALWCAAVYGLLTQHASDTDRVRIDGLLSTPPPSAADQVDPADNFAAMVAAAAMSS